MDYDDKIESLIEPVLKENDSYLVDIEIKGGRLGKTVELFVDNEKGITTQICAKISREISPLFEEEKIFEGRYNLVISSPGIDRPLKFLKQYPKNVGRTVSVKRKVPPGGGEVKTLTSQLAEVRDDCIVLKNSDGTDEIINIADIIETRVIAKI